MTQTELISFLQYNHYLFIELIDQLDEQSFSKKFADKWTPAQQAQHIHLSVKPLNTVFKFPLFTLRLIFGKANRPSKTYGMIIEKYHSKLAEGGRATSKFIPKEIPFSQRDQLVDTLKKDITKLCKLSNKYSEEELDQYILPHPLLGKLTLREMLYFTAYHVQHHEQLVKQILEN